MNTSNHMPTHPQVFTDAIMASTETSREQDDLVIETETSLSPITTLATTEQISQELSKVAIIMIHN